MPGDLNCDGAVSPADLRPFAEAIHDPAGWCQRFACPLAELLIRADFNADGAVTPADIPGFTARLALAWPGSAGAPEMQAAGLDGATGSEGLTDPGGIDLDIDSDNTNGRGFPERSPAEDAVEAAAGARGKYLPVNSDDDDANGIPDGQQGPPAPGDDDLRPLLLELRPAQTVPALQPVWDSLSWRLAYAGADVRVRLSTSDGAPGAVLDPPAVYTQLIWVLGDLNADGAVTFDDIDPFILALACLDDAGPFVAAYWTPPPGHPGYPDFRQVGDLNGDGALNFDDIDWLVGAIGAPPRYLPVRLWAEAPPGMRTEVTALLTASGDVDGPGPRGLDVEDQVLVRRFLLDCAGAPGCDCDFRGACVNPAPGIPPFIPRGDCAQYDAHIYLAGACLVCQCEILKHGTPCLASGFIGWFLNGEEIGGGASTWERLYPGALGTPGPGTLAGGGPCQGWGTCAPSASFALVPGVLPPGEYRLVGLWECFCDGCICPGTFDQTFTVVAARVRELESNDHGCACCEPPLGWCFGVPACPANRDVRSVLELDAGGATVLPTVARRMRLNAEPWSDWQIWGPHQSSPNEFHAFWPCWDFVGPRGRIDRVQWCIATTPPVELPPQEFVTIWAKLEVPGGDCTCDGPIMPAPLCKSRPGERTLLPLHLEVGVPRDPPVEGAVTLSLPSSLQVWSDEQGQELLISPGGEYTWPTAGGVLDKTVYAEGIAADIAVPQLRVAWQGAHCSVSAPLAVIDVRVKQITFAGDGFHTILEDGAEAYSPPHWMNNWDDPNGSPLAEDVGDTRIPVLYVRSLPTEPRYLSLTAEFYAEPDAYFRNRPIWVAAASDNPACVGLIAVAEYGGGILTLPETPSFLPLPTSIQSYSPPHGLLMITWGLSFDEGLHFVPCIATTDHRLYVCHAAPSSTTTLYESVVDIACRNAIGATEDAAIVDGIWAPFADRLVCRKPLDGNNFVDGVRMGYWRPPAMTPQTLAEMLGAADGNGSCCAWAQLLAACLQVHGVGTFGAYPRVRIVEITANRYLNPGATGFLVRNWVFGQGGILTGPDGINNSDAQGDDEVIIPKGSGLPHTLCMDGGPNGTVESAPGGDDYRDYLGLGLWGVFTGANGVCETEVQGDEQALPTGQGLPDAVCAGPGPDGVLATTPGGDDEVVGDSITTGANGICDTPAQIDEQVLPMGQGLPGAVCVRPGANGMLATTPSGDDRVEGATITAGADGVCDTQATDDDEQVLPVGQGAPGAVCVGAGPGALATAPGGDDHIVGDTITTGANGVCETHAVDDAQRIAVGQGAPHAVCVRAGPAGYLVTSAGGDDQVAGDTITTGADGICNTTAALYDDVQIIPLGQGEPDAMGIIAGPNGTVDTTPTPDDAPGSGQPLVDVTFPYELHVSVVNLPGIAGQDNPEPPGDFRNHYIVRVYWSGTQGDFALYDPSYGAGPFATEINHENAAIDGIRGPIVPPRTRPSAKQNDVPQELVYIDRW